MLCLYFLTLWVFSVRAAREKYQEGHICRWDCLDMIASYGYHPINALDEAVARIHRVAVQKGKVVYRQSVRKLL